jgi:hypothetical protein
MCKSILLASALCCLAPLLAQQGKPYEELVQARIKEAIADHCGNPLETYGGKPTPQTRNEGLFCIHRISLPLHGKWVQTGNNQIP